MKVTHHYVNYGTVTTRTHAYCMTYEEGNKFMVIYYSYKTPVAFVYQCKDNKVISAVCENKFSKTTGRYLNYLNSDHKVRVDVRTFQSKLDEACLEMGIEL